MSTTETEGGRLADLLAEYAELEARLADPAIHADQNAARKVGRRFAELTPIHKTAGELAEARADLEAARELAAEDPAFAAEAEALADALPPIEERLAELLAPRDPDDAKDLILEVKAGEGGEESALFAGDLVRMYTRYAERRGWTTEVLDAQESDLGGYKDIAIAIKTKGVPEGGYGVWSRLKWEGGVHRVQRVPATESQGRIHTSAVGVLVTPEVGGHRGLDRREGPARRRLPFVRTGWPERQHDRLGRTHHAPAHRHRRLVPERALPAAEQGPCDADAAGQARRALRGAGRRRGVRRPQGSGAYGRPVGAHPDVQLPAEPCLRSPNRLHRIQSGPRARR